MNFRILYKSQTSKGANYLTFPNNKTVKKIL